MKILNGIKKNRGRNKGMTYVELIVVLSIFSSLSAVVMFNYSAFQSRIDIKNLSNDIGLKIIEAQKFAVAGRLPPSAQGSVSSTWKPSYGIYINPGTDNKSFNFFTDLDQDGIFDTSACPGTGECLEKVSITKGNIISAVNPSYPLSVFYHGDTTAYQLSDLTISFIRPNGSAVIKSATTLNSNINYAQISVLSPKGDQALVKVYASGKIEIR